VSSFFVVPTRFFKIKKGQAPGVGLTFFPIKNMSQSKELVGKQKAGAKCPGLYKNCFAIQKGSFNKKTSFC
jgi:hypothetical protein